MAFSLPWFCRPGKEIGKEAGEVLATLEKSGLRHGSRTDPACFESPAQGNAWGTRPRHGDLGYLYRKLRIIPIRKTFRIDRWM